MRPPHAWRLGAAAVGTALALAAAAPAAAQSAADHLGSLGEGIELETAGRWTKAVGGGWFTLSNDDTPKSAYRVVRELGAIERDEVRRLGVNLVVRGRGDDRADGGMIVVAQDRKDWERSHTFLLTIGADRKARLHRLNPEADHPDTRRGEFSLLEEYDGVRARLDGSDILEVVESERGLAFVLNDAEFGTLPDWEIAAAGIVAYGAGLFGFDGWEMSVTKRAASLPPPRRAAPEAAERLPAPADETPEADADAARSDAPVVGAWLNTTEQRVDGEMDTIVTRVEFEADGSYRLQAAGHKRPPEPEVFGLWEYVVEDGQPHIHVGASPNPTDVEDCVRAGDCGRLHMAEFPIEFPEDGVLLIGDQVFERLPR